MFYLSFNFSYDVSIECKSKIFYLNDRNKLFKGNFAFNFVSRFENSSETISADINEPIHVRILTLIMLNYARENLIR
jgi:hypothetical protein